MKLTNAPRIIARASVLALTAAGVLAVGGGAASASTQSAPTRIDSIKVATCPQVVTATGAQHQCTSPAPAKRLGKRLGPPRCDLRVVNGRVAHVCPDTTNMPGRPPRFIVITQPYCPQKIVNGRSQHVCMERPTTPILIEPPYCPKVDVNGRSEHVCMERPATRSLGR